MSSASFVGVLQRVLAKRNSPGFDDLNGHPAAQAAMLAFDDFDIRGIVAFRIVSQKPRDRGAPDHPRLASIVDEIVWRSPVPFEIEWGSDRNLRL